jgi:tellurite resistance protein TehA-like permease
MSTGGIANIIHSLKWTAPWLRGIGLFFFFLNIVLFIMNCVLICTRFHLRPGSFINSFTDQIESLFISASVGIPIIHHRTLVLTNTSWSRER